MKNITNYYVEDKSKLISNKDAYIVGKKFRITVLSHRLVRIEYSEKGLFEDRPTSLIINRSFPKIDYFITESDSMIEINTGVFTLTYVKDSPIKSGILSVISLALTIPILVKTKVIAKKYAINFFIVSQSPFSNLK